MSEFSKDTAADSFNHMADPRGPSFISRLRDTTAVDEKAALGKLFAEKVFDPAQPLFIASGTTAFMIAKHLLSTKPGTNLWTNSAPLLQAYVELQDAGQLAPHVTLSVIKGEVNPTTGIISASPIPRLPTRTLLYSPHGLTKRGVVGRRDIAQIKAMIAAHPEIIMPITWDKLLREAPSVIKYLGHAEKEILSGKRRYRLLFASG